MEESQLHEIGVAFAKAIQMSSAWHESLWSDDIKKIVSTILVELNEYNAEKVQTVRDKTYDMINYDDADDIVKYLKSISNFSEQSKSWCEGFTIALGMSGIITSEVEEEVMSALKSF